MKKPNEYNHLQIEKKWQKEWQAKKTYKTEDNSKKKKMYVLDMFPYPSGAGLHVGHPRGYIGSDVYARMKRMQGFNVLHPMGYDAFGLPAEQFAVANKIHPRKAVEKNVATFEKQLSIIGLSYDWSRKVNTTDPDYYKWTEWIFLKLYGSWYDKTKDKARPIEDLTKIFQKSGNKDVEASSDADTPIFSAEEWKGMSKLDQEKILMKYRLTYEGYSEVNWCPGLGTVLANDEIVDGKDGPVSERGGYPVEKRLMRQWFMRITAYAERLLTDLGALDWSEHIKEIQRNWIGRSNGSLIPFQIKAHKNPPKQILVGTRNEAKFKMAKECFPHVPGIELVSLNDIPPVDDSMLVEGQDFMANAKMKSEFYFKKTGIPTISLDNVFWVEKWPKDDHIVIHMRKEAGNGNDKTSDEDVIAFFQKWLKKVGDSKAHFIFGLAYTDSNGTRVTSSTQREYRFQSKRIKGNFWKGYPTECLLVDAKTGVCKGNQTIPERYNIFMSCLKNEVVPWINLSESIDVFTTRPDTLFGVTYISIAPESDLVSKLQPHVENWSEVEKYIDEVKKKTQEERTNAEKEKTGVMMKGVYAINPANGDKVPVWIADYVLAGYGTGAVMAVPAHDERDFAFAQKYSLPTIEVIHSLETDAAIQPAPLTNAFTQYGILGNSKQFDGLSSEEAKKKITDFVGGKLVTKYRMRDAVFARQRYWGEPIPLRHDKDGIIAPLKEKDLPLKLPNVTSYEPTGTGESPLAGVSSWVKAGYETNTMPGWAGSSWYFLRYADPKNKKEFASKKSLNYWFGKKDGGVDMYVGGAEHATGHLLYSRFWHKFLYDLGYVPVKEPFKSLRNQGMIGGADGRKMSKRWGNVVNPDDVIATYGADSLRVFEMFLGPFDSHLPWSTEGIIGSRRFVEKVWRLGQKILVENPKQKTDEEIAKVLHKTIKKVTEDIAGFNFNTAVSSMMICLNEMERGMISRDDFKKFLQILAPFASHTTEELWNEFGEKKSIHLSTWPKYDPKKLIDERIKIAVSVNGKVRVELVVTPDMSEEEVKAEVMKDKTILGWIEGKEIKRIIYVPGRLVNIVI